MRSLGQSASSLMAVMASASFLHGVRRGFLAEVILTSCWVMVEPPETIRPVAHGVPRCARDGEGVDAGMVKEAPVLGGERGEHEMPGDFAEADGSGVAVVV